MYGRAAYFDEEDIFLSVCWCKVNVKDNTQRPKTTTQEGSECYVLYGRASGWHSSTLDSRVCCCCWAGKKILFEIDKMKKLKKGGQRSKAEEGDKVEAVQPKMEDKHSKAEKENKVEAAQPQPKKKGKRFKRKVEENGDAANSEPKKRGKHFKGKPKTEENGETEPAEKPKKGSDVLENKTVFIRNLDFDTTEEDLAELLTTFGELEYCKVCLDSYTERSRGTAFAKFKTVEAAQNCLAEAQQASLRLYIDGRQLNIAMAVPREQVGNIQQQNSDSRHKKKDKRNLYLAREGLIYPNSPAAVGVSQSDLQKRLAVSLQKLFEIIFG